MKLIIITTMLAVVLSACGKSEETSSTNSSNSKTANSSSSSSSSPEPSRKDSEPKDMTPLTMSVSEMVGSYDESKEGRMVTVTGGRLEEIKYNSLMIRDGSSYAFYCNGSFSDYTKMAPQIDSLKTQGKSPVATVKGIYQKGVGSGADLESCILTDLAK